MFKGMSGKIMEFNYLPAIREISPTSGIQLLAGHMRDKPGQLFVEIAPTQISYSRKPWTKSLSLCKSIEKEIGKEKALSLRRHYPVQVRRDFLSLTCLHPGQNSQVLRQIRHPRCVSYVNNERDKDVKQTLNRQNNPRKSFITDDRNILGQKYKKDCPQVFSRQTETKYSPKDANEESEL